MRHIFPGSSDLTIFARRPAAALAVVLLAACGSGGSQSNPPLPNVVITADAPIVDVGERFHLDGSGTTDPNGDAAKLTFDWRLVDGGEDTSFDDHCREDFAEICSSNDNDHCSNDTNRLCNSDADCVSPATCALNSGTTSSDCSTGLCGLGEGDTLSKATFVADVAGPYTVRLSVKGSKSNGTNTITLDTAPSLFVVGSLLQFGGTKGAFVGAAADAAEYAAGATRGAADPKNGNLILLDPDLGILRVFDLRTGKVLGAFGESDRFADAPTALTFHPDTQRLYVAQADGQVLVFDDATGLLVATFGNVGPGAVAMAFQPETGELLVGYGGVGLKHFAPDGTDLGTFGDTANHVDEAVDIAILPTDPLNVLVADGTGAVWMCEADGAHCQTFSEDLDSLLPPVSPSAVAINPSYETTDADVLVSDPVHGRVISCDLSGHTCEVFGETDQQESDFADLVFSPVSAPTTSTTTTTLP